MPRTAGTGTAGSLIGVIGCGGVACQYQLPALESLSDARVAAVADPRRGARERAVALTGADAFADPYELLAQLDIDAVLICADSRAHAELACAGAEAGKHIYLEKPIALTIEDADRVIESAVSARIATAMGFNYRFHPLYRGARGLLGKRRIGEIGLVRTRFHQPVTEEAMRWRRRRASGGGALLDLGSHHLDLIPWFLDDEIDTVRSCALDSEVTEDDFVRLTATTRDGVTIEAEFSYRRRQTCEWEFVGDRGRLIVDRHARSLRVLPHSGSRDRIWTRRLRSRLFALPLVRGEPSFRLSVRSFLERIRGAESECATLDDGVRNLRIMLNLEAAARTG